MKENYRLILTGQHLLILTYNLIFEEITTKNFPIHVKIYTGLPINQVIWDSNNAARTMNLPLRCDSSHGRYTLRLRFIEQPIVFSFAIRYNRDKDFVSKQVL